MPAAGRGTGISRNSRHRGRCVSCAARRRWSPTCRRLSCAWAYPAPKSLQRTGNRLENAGGGPLNIDVRQLGVRGVSGENGRRRIVAPRVALATGLVLVHPAVRRREKRFVRFPILRENGSADADAELQPLGGTRFEVDVLHRFLQFLPLVLRLVGAAAREHDDEFITRVAD